MRMQGQHCPSMRRRNGCALISAEEVCGSVGIYIAGVPCQPFSTAGLRQGFAAPSDGDLFFHALQYIRLKRPVVFILENVQGLDQVAGGTCFHTVLRALWSMQVYRVFYDLLDTKDHGLPESRPRYYFIGILRTHCVGEFRFPEPIRTPHLEAFLDPRLGRPSWADLPPLSQSTARANVLALLRNIEARGRDPFAEPWVLDCDSSAGRACAMFDCSPCLTRSRSQGHWVSNRGRRMRLREMMRLHGLDSDSIPPVPEAQFRLQMGNMMSICALERIFCKLLPAAGLWNGRPLVDRHLLAAAGAASEARPAKRPRVRAE